MGQAARAGEAWREKTDQVKTTTQRYYPTDSMLNHSTCNRFFFSLDGLRGAALRSASGLGRVARVRADVREQCRINSATESSGTVNRYSISSTLRVSSQRLWLDGPCRDPGFPVFALRQGLMQSRHVDGGFFWIFHCRPDADSCGINSCRSTGKHACSLPEWYHYRQTGWRLFLDFHLLLFGLGRTLQTES